jgi:predicted nucleotidyltransferase
MEERKNVDNPAHRAVAEPNTIIRTLVGSTVHGLQLPGKDDRDEMGVCIEPKEYVMGLAKFEQWVYRTQPEGMKSGPGDLDLTVYSLRKYARLAAKGNPTVLLLLYAPRSEHVVSTPLGDRLQAMAPAFVSKRAGNAFLRYMVNQRQALVGERGGYRSHRTELIEEFGYDTKYAMHMIRLGFEGRELLEQGHLTLPMREEFRREAFAVRCGEYSLESVLELADSLESDLQRLLKSTHLADEPDYATINRFLIEAHEEWWKAAR